MILVHCLNALIFLTRESLRNQLPEHLSSWNELAVLVVLEVLALSYRQFLTLDVLEYSKLVRVLLHDVMLAVT